MEKAIENLSSGDIMMKWQWLGRYRDYFESYCEEREINSEEYTSFEQSLNELENFDQEIQQRIINYIDHLANSGLITPEQIPLLIRKVSYHEDDVVLEQDYPGRVGAMSWNNFEITFHRSLLSANESHRDIEHHFGHEIGHSIFEALEKQGLISISDIQDLFKGISYNYESGHTLCLKNEEDKDPDSGNNQLLLKERFSELIGIYLKAHQADNPEQFFCQERHSLADNDIDRTNLENVHEYVKESMTLFRRLGRLWKEKINPGFNILNPDEHCDQIFFNDDPILFDELVSVPFEEEKPKEKELSQSQAETSAFGQDDLKPKTSEKKNLIGQKKIGEREDQNRETIRQSVIDFIASFAKEVDVLNIGGING